jgi:NAD(P)-dependent dehydrogenase (short-subunit alcohol dehydrogenase family)
MPARFAGRVVLVTGAGKGIGRAIAQRLVAEGARVACLDLDEAGVKETAAALGDTALALTGDVTSPASAEAAVKASLAAFGALHGLVNNAAAPSTDGTVVDLALGDWNREIAVSLTGAFLMSKYAVPPIAAGGGGSIVHVASQFGHVAVAGSAAYCAAKAGLVNLAKVMALDHAAQKIRVNTLSPRRRGHPSPDRQPGQPGRSGTRPGPLASHRAHRPAGRDRRLGRLSPQ